MLRTSIDLLKENTFILKKARSRGYPAQTITDVDYTYDNALLANTPTQAESLMHSLKKTVGGIGSHDNANKTDYMCFNQNQIRDISILTGGSLKLEEKFIYLRSSISSAGNDISTRLAKAWSAIDVLSVISKSELSDKLKRNFFEAAYYTMEAPHGRWLSVGRKSNCATITSISKTIKIRWTTHAGHWCGSREELISDIPLWFLRTDEQVLDDRQGLIYNSSVKTLDVESRTSECDGR